jgi:hypothetical protein
VRYATETRVLPLAAPALLIAATLQLSGCDRLIQARGTPDGAGAVVSESAAPDSPLLHFFRTGPIEVGSTRAEITAQLGEPDSVVAVAVLNRHDPETTDSIFTLFYPGLAANVYRADYDGKELLAALAIEDDRYLQPHSPIHLGTSGAAVRAALGEPDESDQEFLLYICDECLVAGHESIRFLLAQGAVRRIELHYWID